LSNQETRISKLEEKIGPLRKTMIAIEQELHETFEDAQARYEQEFGSLPTENVTIIHVEYVASLMQETVPRVYE
jgi:hypothetical protein